MGYKKIFVFIISIIFCLISFSGCISTDDFPTTPKGPSKRPRVPVIVVDSNNNSHIIWNTYEKGQYNIKYMKINYKGKILLNKIITHRVVYISKLLLSPDERVLHYFWGKSYLQITTNGKILIEKLFSNITLYKDRFYSTRDIDAIISPEGLMHLIWINENLTTSYGSLNDDGEMIRMEYLNKFIKNITFYGNGVTMDFSFHIDIDINKVIWIAWVDGGNTFDTKSNTISGINKTLSGNAIKTDSLGNVYLFSGKYVKKIGNNGTLMFKENLSDIRVIPGYPVIKGEDGKYIYFGDNGYIDSENNLHLVNHVEELKTWESGRYREDFYFHTIYYSEIASNGTVLIDNMIIDTDGEPNWESVEYANQLMITFLVIAIPAVIILLIFIKFFVIKKKKKEGNIREQQKRF